MNRLSAPEINISIFGFLLNFVWEIWQAPLFKSMDSLTHFQATLHCTQAALGDVVILLIAFWTVALITKSRRWIIHANTRQVIGFILIGVVITVAIEEVAVHLLQRWQYATTMPTLPILGTGIVPILQWLFIPPIIVAMMQRKATDV